MLGRVLPGVHVSVFDRHPDRAAALADAARATEGIASAEPASAREAVEGADVVVTAASFGPVRQVMTSDWLAADALVVPVDYATYCAAEVAAGASLFLVDHREQFLANRDAGLFEGYGPDRDDRRGHRRGHAAAPTAGGSSSATSVSARRPRVRRCDPPAGRGAGARDRPAGLTTAGCSVGQTVGRPGHGRAEVVVRLVGTAAPHPVVLVVAVAALTGIVGAVTLRGLPQQDGAIQVAGLESSATVLRDEHGIVNIYADSTHDLFLAQGYVHAQERLWQMEVWRHISAGRLSELFGKSTLDQDRFIRTLGWRQAAERDFAALSEGPRAALDAYAEGVSRVHRGAPRARSAWRSWSPGCGTGPAASAATSWSRGRRSTRWPGRRSRPGSSAATSTPRSSGCWPTSTSATRR